jgi:hypothetical protein
MGFIPKYAVMENADLFIFSIVAAVDSSRSVHIHREATRIVERLSEG